MSEINAAILKNAVVQKGKHKGLIENPLTAQEEANTILESIGQATPEGYTIDKKAKHALDAHVKDYVLTAQAEKTVGREKDALLDPLTGVLNHKAIFQEVNRAIAEVDRKGGGIQVVFMDLRRFKLFNDTYGHLVGDKALVTFVTALQKHMREYDKLGRWGGEEFVLLVKSGSDSIVQTISDRVHNTLRELEAPFNELQVDMGSSSYNQKSTKTIPPLIIYQADQAMYFAKKNNLDRVQPWNEAMTSIEVPK